MGSADIILDLVSTGVTLRENNLKQLEGGMIMESQGALVANRRALLERPVSLGGGGGDGGAGLVGGPELGGRARAGATRPCNTVHASAGRGRCSTSRHAAHLPACPLLAPSPFLPCCRACWRSATS